MPALAAGIAFFNKSPSLTSLSLHRSAVFPAAREGGTGAGAAARIPGAAEVTGAPLAGAFAAAVPGGGMALASG
jgi:hypothetical protein